MSALGEYWRGRSNINSLAAIVTFESLCAFLTQTGMLGGGKNVLVVGAGVALNSDAQSTKIILF